MNIIIKTRNIELIESLEKFINEKINKLEKFLGTDTQEIFVEIEKENRHHRKGDVFSCQIFISIPGRKLAAKAHGEDLLRSVIDAKDQMEIEIKKHKEKKIDANRRQAKKEGSQESF
jgi:ribosomal subunit interface protein